MSDRRLPAAARTPPSAFSAAASSAACWRWPPPALGLKCHVLSPEADSCAFDVVQRVDRRRLRRQGGARPLRARMRRHHLRIRERAGADRGVPLRAQAGAARPEGAGDHAGPADREGFRRRACRSRPRPMPRSATRRSCSRRRAKIGQPAVLKTRRFGYDGKGQIMIRDGGDPAARLARAQRRALRSSKASCRSSARFRSWRRAAATARSQSFDVTENEHRDHILKTSRVPAAGHARGRRARRGRIAESIADAFDYVGVLAVEMFVVQGRRRRSACWSTRSRRACTIPATGPSTAPRCRNSSSISARSRAGRWRQPVRRGRIEMINLIGAEVDDYASWLAMPGAAVHLYGKAEARPGRKMGHVTQVFPVGPVRSTCRRGVA